MTGGRAPRRKGTDWSADWAERGIVAVRVPQSGAKGGKFAATLCGRCATASSSAR